MIMGIRAVDSVFSVCACVSDTSLCGLSTHKIRDSREGDDRGGADQVYGQRENRLSMAFSILCMVLTVLYAGFAALTFFYSNGVMDEYTLDEREEAMMLSTRNKTVVNFNVGYDGYIGDRFDVGRPAGFVSPTAPEATLA